MGLFSILPLNVYPVRAWLESERVSDCLHLYSLLKCWEGRVREHRTLWRQMYVRTACTWECPVEEVEYRGRQAISWRLCERKNTRSITAARAARWEVTC